MDFASGSAPPGDPAIGDEDYDLLNDETFGDIQEDFDWDEATAIPVPEANGSASTTKLELAIKGLGIDDEPDDPAIVTFHTKRLPSTSEEDNLKAIYNAHSPPAYVTNIDGLLNPSKDIWGSPPTGFLSDSKEFSVQPDSVRDAYLSTSAEKVGCFPPPPSLSGERVGSAPVAMPKNAVMVEDLEKDMSSAPVPVPSQCSSQVNPLLTRYGSPYHSAMADTPPTPPTLPGFIGSPQTRSPMQVNGMMMGAHMAAAPNAPVHNRAPVTILQRPQMIDQQMHRMAGGQGFSQPRPPPGLFNGMQGYPRPQRGPMMPPVLNRYPLGPSRPGMAQPRFMMGQQPHIYPHMMPPRDEYAGILTQKEKDWLMKIQMIQLHTDDPYTDDYYFTIFNVEKAAKANASSGKSSLILPALAKVETRHYTPTQFEGSLGRLTSSSVHKPRQVLDVGKKNDHLSHTAAETKKYRQYLLTAEKGYQLLLDIDELNKQAPSIPEGQRSSLLIGCQKKLNELHQLVEDDWSALFNVRKGRSLILRTIPLVDRSSSRHLLSRLFTALPSFVKKELADPVGEKCVAGLSEVFTSYDINSLIELSSLLKDSLGSTVKTSLGCHLVMLMVSQSEKIYSAYVDVPEEVTDTWNHFLDQFLKSLGACKRIPKLRGLQSALSGYLSRRPDSEEPLTKVKEWFA